MKMRAREEIIKELEGIEADERVYYEPATVQINAPLALIQVGLDNTYAALRFALGEGYGFGIITTKQHQKAKDGGD